MSQPNLLEFADWLANESLYSLTNPMSVSKNMNTDYIQEYERDFAVGETIRIPYPQRYAAVNGFAYSPQALNRKHATVTIDQPIQVSFEWNTIEQALKLTRGREKIKKEVIDPAMNEMRQQIESRAALFAYQNCPNIVGVLGTDPTSFSSSSGAARRILVEQSCVDDGDWGAHVTPSYMQALKAAQITYFNPQVDVSKAFRKGIIGSADNFDFHENVSLQSHTAGTIASTFTVSGAGQSGNSLLVNCTSGDVVNQGDVIGIGNCYPVNPSTRRAIQVANTKTVVVSTTTTSTGATMTIPLVPTGPGGAIAGPGDQYQNISALPANGATLTLFPGTSSPNGKIGINSLYMQRDAFALVGIPLGVPTEGAEIAKQVRDPDSNLSVAVIRMFDPVERKWINRFDCLIGFGVLYAENCAVRGLGA